MLSDVSHSTISGYSYVAPSYLVHPPRVGSEIRIVAVSFYCFYYFWAVPAFLLLFFGRTSAKCSFVLVCNICVFLMRLRLISDSQYI